MKTLVYKTQDNKKLRLEITRHEVDFDQKAQTPKFMWFCNAFGGHEDFNRGTMSYYHWGNDIGGLAEFTCEDMIREIEHNIDFGQKYLDCEDKVYKFTIVKDEHGFLTKRCILEEVIL